MKLKEADNNYVLRTSYPKYSISILMAEKETKKEETLKVKEVSD